MNGENSPKVIEVDGEVMIFRISIGWFLGEAAVDF